MKLVFAILLWVLWTSQVMAQQCFPHQGPGFVNSSPGYMGGHFQNQALLAPAQAYQPQQYYFPQGNVHLSQPPILGGGMRCQPSFMNRPFQTSFGRAPMQPPNFMMNALPYLGQGLTGLADYFADRPRPSGKSYEQFLAESGRSSSSSSRDSRIDNDSFYSDLPDSNSAGASGRLSAADPDSMQSSDETKTEIGEKEKEKEKKEPEDKTEAKPQPEQTEDSDRAASDDDQGIDLSDPENDRIPLEEIEVPRPETIPPQSTEDTLEDIVDQTEKLPEQTQGLLSRVDCLDLIRDQSRNNSPLQGAFRVMATLYQDCESLTRILDHQTPLPELNVSIQEDMNKIKKRMLQRKDREHYFNEHPYLKDRDFDKSSSQCRDLRESPPIFSYGAKARFKGGAGGNIDLFRNQAEQRICKYSNVECNSAPVTALDCSGFIHAALKASGLKIQKGSEHPHYSTIAFNDIAMKEDSCFEELSFSAEQTLAPGDIISQSQHHMFMISGVGDDPLGVKKALKNGDCSRINRDDFDFTFIQSGASRSMGVAHLSSDYPEVSTTIFNNLMVMAQETCERAQSGEGRLRARTRSARSSMVVMRHAGQSDPECIEPSKPTLEGEECVEDCLK